MFRVFKKFKTLNILFSRKNLYYNKTVLITDSGSLVEYTKAYKIIKPKELGKMIL